MKNILFGLISLIFITNLNAVEEKDIASVMQEKVNKATQILTEGKCSIKEKADKIFADLDSVFDIELMGRLSLGRYWKSLDSKQKEEFTKEFETYMKKSYVDKLELYNNEKIVIKEANKVKENRIWLNSEIQGEKENYEIIYKFYKTKTKGWLIYDVDIIGVSIIKTYKAQFSDTIANNSFEYLLKEIKDKK